MGQPAGGSLGSQRLYGDLAWTWPIVSPPADYVDEAEQFVRLLRQHSRIRVDTLLHLGCGGGHLDRTLKRHARVTGVDVSPQMLRLARRLNPEVTYLRGDMRTVRLGRLFDAVIAADSISYVLTEADLRRTFRTAFLHLRPGGIFATYVERTPQTFREDRTSSTTGSQGPVTVTFIESVHDPDPRDTTYETLFLYLIRRRGRLRIEADRHRMGLFPLATWRRLLKEAGFRVLEMRERRYGGTEDPVVAFVGVKPLRDADVQRGVAEATALLRRHRMTCSTTAAQLRAWFRAETIRPDIGIEEVLRSPFLVVHELVEIEEALRMGLRLTKDVFRKHVDEVDAAHLRAAEVEVRIAIAERARPHLHERLRDIRRWARDTTVPRSRRVQYRELANTVQRALSTVRHRGTERLTARQTGAISAARRWKKMKATEAAELLEESRRGFETLGVRR